MVNSKPNTARPYLKKENLHDREIFGRVLDFIQRMKMNKCPKNGQCQKRINLSDYPAHVLLDQGTVS